MNQAPQGQKKNCEKPQKNNSGGLRKGDIWLGFQQNQFSYPNLAQHSYHFKIRRNRISFFFFFAKILINGGVKIGTLINSFVA